jgi:hypothetical protein
MCLAKTIRDLTWLWVLILVGMTSAVSAQPFIYAWDNGAGNNDWHVGQNWNINNTDGVDNVVPFAFFDEEGLINNGDTVNVSTMQNQFDNGAAGQPADNQGAPGGVTVDGNSNLVIENGGTLGILISAGVAPTSGNATLNSGAITVESGGQLSVQNDLIVNGGLFTVDPGGQATAQNITTARDAGAGTDGMVMLSGSAMLTSTSASIMGGTTTINGPSVTLNTGGMRLTDTSIFHPVITGGTHSVINSTGGVTLNGTLRPEFVGVTPSVGDQWALWDATVIGNEFDVADDSLSPLATGLRYAIHTTSQGSTNGVRGLLTVENFLTAQVNRATGEVILQNTFAGDGGGGSVVGDYNDDGTVNAADYVFWRNHEGGPGGSLPNRDPNNGGNIGPDDYTSWVDNFGNTGGGGGGVEIDGYTIFSTAGSLDPNALTSGLEDDNFGGGGWLESNLTTGAIAELNPNGSSVVGTSTNNSLGNIYDRTAPLTQFGQPVPEDIFLTYRTADGRNVVGAVEYINDGIENTLVLQVDPNDGDAMIINSSPFDVEFDGYRVISASGTPSLNTTWNSLEDQAVDAWLESGATTNILSELNPTGTLAVDAGETAAVLNGLFNTVTGVQDLDFEFRVPGIGLVSGVVRFQAFAGSGSSAAVPEPASLVLLSLLALAGFAGRTRSRRTV